MENANSARRALGERIWSLELENGQYDPRFCAIKKEILKVALLEVDQGDPPIGELRVLMMHDLYVYFSCKTKGSVP